MIARLRPGVTAAAAIDEANALGSAIRPPRPANAAPLPGAFDVQGVKIGWSNRCGRRCACCSRRSPWSC
jgi:hypothetical protein